MGVLIRDAAVVASGGAQGNLAETFIGSASFDYRVLSQTETSARVEITVRNPTTIDSATRIPLSGLGTDYPLHIEPLFRGMWWLNGTAGAYESIGQQIVWIERIALP